MPNIIFYLNTGASVKSDLFPLLAKITYKGKRKYKTIGRVKKSDWNEDKHQVRQNHKNAPYNKHKELNTTINNLEAISKRVTDYCLLNDYPITEKMIDDILKGIDPIKGKQSVTIPDTDFNQTFNDWLEDTKKNNAFNTYRSRNTAYNFFQDFQNDNNLKLTFRNIDMAIFDQLKDYANEKKEYSNNTFAKTIKIFKTFLQWATDRDYYIGTHHRNFKAPEKDVTPIILTVDEFKTLYYFDFKNKKHQKVRDIFCFACLTGLRYSDLQQLRREHIDQDQDHIIKTIKKTKERVNIPLVELSRNIIERYQEQPVYVLPRMSNQKFNDYLKDICSEAKLTRKIVIDSYKGNRFTETTKELHEVITAHSSRKTFITLSFYLGMDIKIVQSIVGISQEKTLRKYLVIADNMKKTEMEKAWGKI